MQNSIPEVVRLQRGDPISQPVIAQTGDVPRRQLILLGASNIAIGFPVILRLAQSGFSEPLQVFGAFGHGRSYGMWSTVLVRSLPGISTCGLWDELSRLDPQPDRTSALLTDVGNDLLYGASVEQIGDWVESCVEKLRGRGADIALTRLPMASVRSLSALRYNCTRTFFFPFSGLTWPVMTERACALDERLLQIGTRHGLTLIEPPGAWYGFDPIHIRYTRLTAAWRFVFSHWSGFDESAPLVRLSPVERGRIHLLRPAERRILSRPRRTPQPVWQRGRMTISLY